MNKLNAQLKSYNYYYYFNFTSSGKAFSDVQKLDTVDLFLIIDNWYFSILASWISQEAFFYYFLWRDFGMIVKLRKNVKLEQIEKLIGFIESLGFEVDCSFGENTTLIGLIGDTSGLDSSIIKSFEAVDEIIRIQEPYKRANRKFHPEKII